MRIRTVVPVALIVLALLSIISTISTCSLRRQRDAWMRQAALNDSLHQLDAGRYQRAAVALDSERQLRATLKDSLPLLYKELRQVRAESRLYVQTIATLRSDTLRATATDTVYISTEGINISRVDFQLNYDGATVTGFTTTPPPEVVAQIDNGIDL